MKSGLRGSLALLLVCAAHLLSSSVLAQGFRDVPRGPSATAIGPAQGPLQAPVQAPLQGPAQNPSLGQAQNAGSGSGQALGQTGAPLGAATRGPDGGPGQPSHSATAGIANAKEPSVAMAADEIVKALQASPDRPRSAQGTTATPGLPSLPDPGFLDLQIQFEFNSAVILAESHPLLDQVAIALNSPRLKTLRFDIEGHTDGVGTKSNNEILSARRAQSVVAYLTSAGVPAERMRGVGKGFSELLYPFEPKSAANRRVRLRARSL